MKAIGKNSLVNSQKPLAAQAKTDRMNSDESAYDGGPGSGRYPKGSGGGNGKITTPSKTITEVYQEGVGRLNVVQGKPITNKYTIAGTKGKKTVKEESRLIKDYGGTTGKWTKRTQDMVLDVNGEQKTAEVHFYHEPTVGYVEQKVKLFR
jgi:hypothetical protein